MIPERYCPECKQNVPAVDHSCCVNCGYEFEVLIDKAELEELVDIFEVLIVMVDGLAHRLDLPTNQGRAKQTAAKFRTKYLEK